MSRKQQMAAIRAAAASLLIVLASIVEATEGPASPESASSPLAVEAALKSLQKEPVPGKAAEMCGELVTRLANGMHVTDTSIEVCFALLRQTSEEATGENAFANLMAFIDQVYPSLGDRPFLRASMGAVRAEVYTIRGSLDDALAARRQVEAGLLERKLLIDTARNRNLVELGDAYYALGRKAEAETAYLEVLSYPWYNFPNRSEATTSLRDLYIRAGYGLINARRENVAALKEIFFTPAVEEELGPVLQQAISEAEKGY